MEIKSLTSLRAIAAAMVFSSHIGTSDLPIWLDHLKLNGYLGVSIFFILSGYVLIHTYREQCHTYKFWIARFIRIYPLYLIFLLLGLKHGGNNLLGHLLLLQAWDKNSAYDFNPVLWSLSAEAFFYFIFPLLRSLLLRFRHIFGLIILILILLGIVFHSYSQDLYILPLYRLHEFMLGMLFYYLPLQFTPKLISLNLIALSGTSILSAQYNTLKSFLISIILAYLIKWLSQSSIGALESRLGNFLGRISYSFYLSHALVLMSFNNWLLALLITLMISIISYFTIEMRLQEWRRKKNL